VRVAEIPVILERRALKEGRRTTLSSDRIAGNFLMAL
jgi:hypothetical protein